MTPSNPDNQQPLIYRIADALGVFHLVAPVNHTHSPAEVEGLIDELNELWASLDEKANQEEMTEALAAKANEADVTSALDGKADKVSGATNNNFAALNSNGNLKDSGKNASDFMPAMSVDSTPTDNSTNLVTSGGVKAALDAKYSINQVDEDDNQEAHLLAIAEDDDIYFAFRLKNGNTTKEVLMTMPKMDNFARAISNPDSTPTINSTNLVTSGGVKAALDEKANTSTVTAMATEIAGKAPLADTQVQVFALEINPNTGSLASMIMVDSLFQNGNTQATIIIDNKTGDNLDIEEAFYTTTQDDLAFMGENAIVPNIPTDSIVACRILKRDTAHSDLWAHYYLIIDGVIAF